MPEKIFTGILRKNAINLNNIKYEQTIRPVLFNFYVYIEIGGTGGGMFRYMYSRFLKEAAGILSDPAFSEVAEMIHGSGETFTRTPNLFENFEETYDPEKRIRKAGQMLNQIAELETEAYRKLESLVPER
jgi:hypothetical protein